MANDIVIYGLKGSPFVRKVMIALEEKGVGYDIEAVNLFDMPDWFAEISPLRRMPALRDRSVGTEGKAGTLADSSVICAYLDRKHPEPPLCPGGAYGHARALWLEEYADTELAAKFGGGMFRPMIVRQLMGKEPDVETARTTFTEACPAIFDYLEGELAGAAYAVGGTYSIADVALASQFVNFQFAGGRIDAGRWPKLAAYVEFVHARPAFARRIEDEARMMPEADLGL